MGVFCPCVWCVAVVVVVVFSCVADLTSSTRILFVVVVTRWEHTAKRMLSACTCTFSDTVKVLYVHHHIFF